MKVADTAYYLHQLHGLRKNANKGLRDGGALCVLAGVSRSYGLKLLRIMRYLDTTVAIKWRASTKKISIYEIEAISILDSDKQIQAWEAKVRTKIRVGRRKPVGRRNMWAHTQGAKVGEMMRLIGLLQSLRLIHSVSIKFDMKLIRLLEYNGFIKYGKNHKKKHYRQMVKLLIKGYDSGKSLS